jgi:hypothetical protein
MKEFVVKLIVDKYFGDPEFINAKIKELTTPKQEEGHTIRVISMTPITLKDFVVEFNADALSMEGNCLFFWDGKESLGRNQIKAAFENNANVRVIRYDKWPLRAWIGIKWHFPKTKYKSYEAKLFNNWNHLNNWLDKTTGDVNGLEYRLDLNYKP